MSSLWWILIGAAALALLLWIWYIWGNKPVRTDYHIALPGLTEAKRVVHISDLHNTFYGKDQAKLMAMVKEARPDAILLTGDLLDKRRSPRKGTLGARSFIRQAVEVCPVYFVPGNHEAEAAGGTLWPGLRSFLQEMGVHLLLDREETLWPGVRILGLMDPAFDPWYGRKQAARRFRYRGRKLMETKGEGCRILLTHRPEQLDFYARMEVDLVLCGHAHGGQFRLPFVGGLYSPHQGVFPKWTQGVYYRGKTRMLVSRGMGNSAFPLRLLNPPEVIVISLTGENSKGSQI